MKRAIKIDAYERTVTEVQISEEDYKEIPRAIGCDLFCVGTYLPNGDALMVDDEGWLKEEVTKGFSLKLKGDGKAVFAGNGLIVGSDDEGGTDDVKTELIDLNMKIGFMADDVEITDDIRHEMTQVTITDWDGNEL